MVDVIKSIVGLDPKQVNVVGSRKHPNVFKFPNDVDLFESHVCPNTNRKDVVTYYNDKFQSVFKRCIASNLFVMTDFKIGVDKRFKNLVQLSGNIKKNMDKIIQEIEISNLTHDVKQTLRTVLSQATRSEFRNILRSMYILRWNLKELLRRSKTLIDGTNITFEECLLHNSMIKMDVIYYDNCSIYIEAEIVYYLANGKNHPIGYKLPDFEMSLLYDIHTKYRNNPIKQCKRIFNLQQLYLKHGKLRERIIPNTYFQHIMSCKIVYIEQLTSKYNILRTMTKLGHEIDSLFVIDLINSLLRCTELNLSKELNIYVMLLIVQIYKSL